MCLTKLIKILTSIFIISLSNLSYGQQYFLTGNELLDYLKNKSSLGTGYILGVTDSKFYEKSSQCNLVGKEGRQLTDIVRIYLENNPATRDLPASLLTEIALTQQLCKK